MNKIDQEILDILKEVFQLKRVRPLESDHNMRLWLVRISFFTSVICLITRIVLDILGHEITSEFSAAVNTPLAFFFTALFLHLNNEVEETSLIIFGLTWIALMLSLYV